MPGVIAVTGATGFIGRSLVDFLSARGGTAIRVLVRNGDAVTRTGFTGTAEIGDMRDPAALTRTLEEGCTWVNVAQLNPLSEADQFDVMASLLEVCRKKRIKRLVHCSTAVVAGRSGASVVTENTDCLPGDRYEAVKLAIEQVLLQKCGGSLEIVTLRPTAARFSPYRWTSGPGKAASPRPRG